MKGYAYIENGKPVVNTKKKPVKLKGQMLDWCSVVPPCQAQLDEYDEALSAWNDSCMEVERIAGYGRFGESFGIEYIEGLDTFDIKTYDPGEGNYQYREVKIGQPATFISTGEKTCKITKID